MREIQLLYMPVVCLRFTNIKWFKIMAANQGDFRTKVAIVFLSIIAVPSISMNVYFFSEKNQRLNEIYDAVIEFKKEQDKQHSEFKKLDEKTTAFFENTFPNYIKNQKRINRKFGENLNDVNFRLNLRPRYDIVTNNTEDNE